ncbi:hypothetical protein ASG11_09925 [Sphingomonas sp. Leaf357]|nr:hypothetical protein ASG11_09925 [Sphingomonas sp. Leaf357]
MEKSRNQHRLAMGIGVGAGGYAQPSPYMIDERGALAPIGDYIPGAAAPVGSAAGDAQGMQGLLAPHMAQPAPPAQPSGPLLIDAMGDAQPAPSVLQDAINTRAPTPEVKRPSFFGKGGLGWDILGTALDIGSGLGGGKAMYWDTKIARRDKEREDTRKDAALRIQQAREDRIARRPILQNMPNVGLVAVDPDTLNTQTVTPYRSAGQAYVEDGLGLTRDNPEYHKALADFTLKSFGPTALQARADLQDDRQQAQEDILRDRYGYQTGLADHREGLVRGRPSRAHPSGGNGAPKSASAVIAPILLKMSRGQPLTPAEQSTLDYQRAGRGGRPAGGSAPTAAPTQTRRDPRTGRTIQLINGQWMENKGGRMVAAQ